MAPETKEKSNAQRRAELPEDLRRQFVAHNLALRDPKVLDAVGRNAVRDEYNNWSSETQSLYLHWDRDPEEQGSYEYEEAQTTAKAIAEKISPGDFCGMIEKLNTWDWEEVRAFWERLTHGPWVSNAGSTVFPFRLFKYGEAYLYLYVDHDPHLAGNDKQSPPRWKPDHQAWNDPDTHIFTVFDPPITIPTHLRSSIDDDFSSSLQYGIPIGSIQFLKEDKIIQNVKEEWELNDGIFTVFIHPVDKSFWIVFNTFDTSAFELMSIGSAFYESVELDPFGFWLQIKGYDPVAVWRMQFPDVKRVALRATPSAGHVSQTGVEEKGDDNGCPTAHIVVDGRDPAWQSMNPARPIPHGATLTGANRYRDEVLKSSLWAQNKGDVSPAP